MSYKYKLILKISLIMTPLKLGHGLQLKQTVSVLSTGTFNDTGLMKAVIAQGKSNIKSASVLLL